MIQLDDIKYELGEIVHFILNGIPMQVNSIQISCAGVQYLCTYICGDDMKSQWFYGHELKKDDGGKMGFGK